MPRNNYLGAKTMLTSGDAKTLADLWKFVDKTPFSRDSKTTPERMNRLLDNISLFKLGDIFNMAQVLGIDDKILLDLIYNDYVKQRRKKKG